jgi:deoxyribodipyrimidine photo-lyase
VSTTILLFRQDLRLHDHPALTAAAQRGAVIPVFVLDDEVCGDWSMGGASRWWLKQSLLNLGSTISQSGGELILRRGDTVTALKDIQSQSGADAIYFSRQYQPWSAATEKAINDTFSGNGIEVKRYPGTLLHEPGSVLTGSGTAFKVFTPFWRAAVKQPVATPLPSPSVNWSNSVSGGEDLSSWVLDPAEDTRVPDWAIGWEAIWDPGEDGAHNALEAFLDEPVAHYSEGRDLPARRYTSRLSPHLKFGEISPRQVWASAQQRKLSSPEWASAIDKFLAEIGWREFCYQLIDLFDAMPNSPFKDQFASFPWDNSEEQLKAWQRGMTGYPIVDAGMRELWQTGFMHNRVRMIVASFLTKHLLVHWLEGERWFWDCLLDADIASNACSWQWVAGSGADAAPYFRIFNPITQGQKFDPEGEYVKRWCPELSDLPKKFVHAPWEAPAMTLASAGVELGKTYPEPIVDHKMARQGALDAYEVIKKAS